MHVVEILTVVKDLGDYDAGDMVDARPEGFQWGRKELERTDIFEIVQVESQVPAHVIKKRIDGVIFQCSGCGEFFDEETAQGHDHPDKRDPETGAALWELVVAKRRRARVDKDAGAFKRKRAAPGKNTLEIAEDDEESFVLRGVVDHGNRSNV